MSSFYSYNYFQWNTEIRAHTLRLEPTSAIFLDNDGGANELANLLPGCKVISRIVSDRYEKELHRTKGEAVRYIQTRAGQVNHSVYINIGCEPPVENLEDMRRLVDEYLAAFEWAQPRGIRVAGPHSAHYGWTEAHWRILAPLAGYIGRYPDLFLLTGDEYFAGVPFSGVQDTRLPEGNEKGHIRPETWRASDTGVYYHVGRMPHNLFPILQEMGLPIPLTVITEAGADDLQDVEPWRESLVHTPPYEKIKGWRSLERQWSLWGAAYGWDARTYFLKGLESIRDVIYKPWPQVIGADLFVMGNNGDLLWLGHNHWDTGENGMMAKLETTNLKGQPPVPTTPAPEPKPSDAGIGQRFRLRTSSSINVREAPTTGGRLLSPAPRDQALLTVYPGGLKTANGFTWYWVEVDGGPSGWQALVYEYAYQQWVTPEPVAKTFLVPASYPHVVSSRFDDPRGYGNGKHEGQDFASLHGNPKPNVVVTPQSGVVEKVGYDATGLGNYIRVYCGDGWRYYLGHFERVLVTEGQTLTEGEAVGHEGSSGNSSGPHVHLTIQHYGFGLSGYVIEEVINPEGVLRAAPVEPEPVPEPPVPPDLYAAVLAQAARLEHAHADLLKAQQVYTLAVAEVLESLRGIVGAQ